MSEAGIAVEVTNHLTLATGIPEIKNDDLLPPDEIPAWLNEKFIENILKKYNNDEKLKVKSLKIQQCGGKGDSYASIMYRIGTFYTDGKSPEKIQFRSCIAKTLPVQDIALEKLGNGNYNVQNKEMEFYEKLLPEFKRLLDSIDEDSGIFPNALAVDKKHDVIVLEDLAEKNFVMADRKKGLDLSHTLIGLRKLARMHAASAMVLEKDPESIRKFDTGFFTRKTDVFHVMYESLCDAFGEELKTWEGFEHYAVKVQNVRKTLVARAQRSFDCDDGEFLALNHGDIWTNNIMFNYDKSGSLLDAVLLDFQFTAVGSPALDVLYFLYTSTFDDLRLEKIEELVQYYYYELNSLVTRLGYDMKKFPTLHEFQIQTLKKYFYVFPTGLLMFPIMITEDKDADFESLMGVDDRALGFKKRLFKNPRYQSLAKKILTILDRKGILDEM